MDENSTEGGSRLACIGLGSNLGQSRRLLLEAWHSLGGHPQIELLRLSSPCRTKPIGMDSANWFINAAGLLRCPLPSEELLDILLATELRFGRVRLTGRQGYQDRTLDLDLLLVEGLMLRTERLTLPHPALHQRLFVLAPLAEITPQLRHPLLHKTIAELLAELEPKMIKGDLERGCWED